jgi:DNA-binding transcriptional ArsR family regulator
MVQIRKRVRSGAKVAGKVAGAGGAAPPASPKEAAGCCGPIDALLDARLFKALADPTRVQLLSCLAKCARACSVGEVAECCSVDLSVVSRHLALLEQAGILSASKQGRTVFYSVRYTDLARNLRGLADALDGCCSPAGGGGCCG